MNFISKNLFEVSRLRLKVMDKFQRGCLKMSQKMVLPTPLWNLSITFRWSVKTWKGFLEIKLNLILQLSLVWIFLKKIFYYAQMRFESCFFTQFLRFYLTPWVASFFVNKIEKFWIQYNHSCGEFSTWVNDCYSFLYVTPTSSYLICTIFL